MLSFRAGPDKIWLDVGLQTMLHRPQAGTGASTTQALPMDSAQLELQEGLAGLEQQGSKRRRHPLENSLDKEASPGGNRPDRVHPLLGLR